MSSKKKIFLNALLFSLPFWWGVNILEGNLQDILFWQEMKKNLQILTAQIYIDEQIQDSKPLRRPGETELSLSAKSALSLFFDGQGKEKILFSLSPEKQLPIASLAKLMTAKIAIENYDLSEKVQVSSKAVSQEEDFGKLRTGMIFKTEYLLYPLLIESSNDAAFSLAHDYPGMTVAKFIDLMNTEAQELKMNNTRFVNPTGLDPEDNEPKTKINYSSAKDVAILAQSLLDTPLVWKILSQPRFDSYGPELINTNALLGDLPRIIGGKTGYTKEAGGCMILVMSAPKNKGYIVNVILGTDDRFGEMKKLTQWLETSWKW